MKPKPWSRIVRPDLTTERDIVSYDLPKVANPETGESLGGGRLTPAEREAIEREAFVKGFAAGEESGRELAMKAVDATTQTLARLITELTEMKDLLRKQAEVDLLKISIAISRRVIRQKLSQNPEVVMEYIHEAIKKIGHAETVLIRIHPQYLDRLTEERAKLMGLVDGTKWLRFEPDIKLMPGECVVETPDRIVDARLDSQLGIIEQKLNKAMNRE